MSNPLYAVAGWAHQAKSLAPLARFLQRQFTVSLFSPHEFSPHYVESLKRLIARDAPPVVVGWSWGGLLALAAMLPNTTSVKALILIAATARFCRTTNYDHGIPSTELKAMKFGLRRSRSETLRRFFQRSFAPIHPDSTLLQPLMQRAALYADHELINGLDSLESLDFREEIATFTVPTLILHGTDDAIIPFSTAHFLAQHMPRTTLVSISGGNHNLPLTHTELVAEKIAVFVREQRV